MFLVLQTGEIDMMGLTPCNTPKQTNTEFFKKTFPEVPIPAFTYTLYGVLT